ncbi:hypothetical protein D3C71_79810 [compost metagenome]
MNRRLFRGIILMFLLGLALAVASKFARAESFAGGGQASARLNISITILPYMRILEQKETPQGLQVTLWTNMPSIDFNGYTAHFDRVGQHTVTLPVLSTQSYDATAIYDGGRLTIASP